jgi:hypothetical protein
MSRSALKTPSGGEDITSEIRPLTDFEEDSATTTTGD